MTTINEILAINGPITKEYLALLGISGPTENCEQTKTINDLKLDIVKSKEMSPEEYEQYIKSLSETEFLVFTKLKFWME